MDHEQQRRQEIADRARYHVEAQRLREQQEAAKAQVLIDRFVTEATGRGLPTQQLTAAPWSGRGRYKTDVEGWYLKHDQSVGVSVDGGFYVLLVPPQRLGRWRTVGISPTPPPLQVGQGGRDGESVALDALLDLRLHW